MTSLLSGRSRSALAFVEALALHGVQPSKADVHAFVEARTSRWDFDPRAEELYVSTVDYLLDARLLTFANRRIALTEAGRALLSSQRPLGDQPVEVVGRMSDPVMYAELLTQINNVPDALIIDPYLHPDDLAALIRLSNVRRILTRDISMPGLKRSERVEQLSIRLGASQHARLRFASGERNELHDRLILPAGSDQALHLGTSLGGTQMTVLTRLSSTAADVLRSHYEPLWERADELSPIRRDDSYGH